MSNNVPMSDNPDMNMKAKSSNTRQADGHYPNERYQDGIHPAARPFLFLGSERVKQNFIWLMLLGMVICIVLGLFYPQKHPLPIEHYIPGSWAIFGFLAYSFIVLCAPFIFKALARDENYYQEGGLPDPDVSTDPHAEDRAVKDRQA